MDRVWAGVDAGKTHHHCVVIDAGGRKLLSRWVASDEPELLALIGDVTALGEATWAVDLPDGGAALLIGLLQDAGQELLYIPGRAVNRASGAYRGEGKTDARDAAVIADQVRMRRDLQPLRPGDELTAELKLLTARRADLVADRTRLINRARGLLTSVFPALERALDLTTAGPLVLLTGFQTPATIREAGKEGLETWLRDRKVRNAGKIAAAASAAAARQHAVLPAAKLTAQLIAAVAGEVMNLNGQVRDLDKLIEERFHRHELAPVIENMPGIVTCEESRRSYDRKRAEGKKHTPGRPRPRPPPRQRAVGADPRQAHLPGPSATARLRGSGLTYSCPLFLRLDKVIGKPPTKPPGFAGHPGMPAGTGAVTPLHPVP